MYIPKILYKCFIYIFRWGKGKQICQVCIIRLVFGLGQIYINIYNGIYFSSHGVYRRFKTLLKRNVIWICVPIEKKPYPDIYILYKHIVCVLYCMHGCMYAYLYSIVPCNFITNIKGIPSYVYVANVFCNIVICI